MRRFSHSSFRLRVHTAWRVWPGKLVSLPGEGRGVSARLQLPFPAWRELAGVETRISGSEEPGTGWGPCRHSFFLQSQLSSFFRRDELTSFRVSFSSPS